MARIHSRDIAYLKGDLYCDKIKFSIDFIEDWVEFDACAFCLRGDGLIGDDADFLFYNSNKRWKAENYKKILEGNVEPFDKNKYSNESQWHQSTIPVSKDCAIIGPIAEYIEYVDDCDEIPHTFIVSLDKIDKSVKKILFCLFYYSQDDYKKDCSVEEICVRIHDYNNNTELASVYGFKDFSGTPAVEVCKLERSGDNSWLIEPINKPVMGGIEELIDQYA